MSTSHHRCWPVPLLLAAGLVLGGCRSGSGQQRPAPLPSATTTTTTDHVERVLTCEEAGRMWLEATAGLEEDLAADPGITGAESVGELARHLGALVAERTDRFAGLGVQPGC